MERKGKPEDRTGSSTLDEASDGGASTKVLQHSHGTIRQLLKLSILLIVSFRLFSLAPYNQLPTYVEVQTDDLESVNTELPSKPTISEKPIKSDKKDHDGSKPSKAKRLTMSDREHVQQLMMEAENLEKMANPMFKSKLVSLYEQVLQMDPRHTFAHLKLGFLWITESDTAEKGFTMFEKTLDGKYVDSPFQHNTPQAFVLSQSIGRYR
jgi:hypothetical protein